MKPAIGSSRDFGEFRLYLQHELLHRCRGNSKYSLRAYARNLGVGSAYLSMLLNGKRRVTPKTVERLGHALDLDPTELERFRSASVRAKKSVPNRTAVSKSFQQIAMDHFCIISDWYHYAILELVQVKSFRSDPGWIAKALGITKLEAKAAVERLLRLGMLEEKSGRLVNAAGDQTNVGNELVASARRKLQKQILQKALEALDELPVTERDQSSMTLSCNRKDLPEAKRKIRDFRRQLTEWLQSSPERDEVFHLSVSLYPVTSLHRQDSKEVSPA